LLVASKPGGFDYTIKNNGMLVQLQKQCEIYVAGRYEDLVKSFRRINYADQ